MERKTFGLIFIILNMLVTMMHASYRTDIYEAYYSNNMQRWKMVIDNMEAEKVRTNTLFPELLNYQYGYIAWCIGTSRKAEAEKYLSLAEKNLDILAKNKFSPSIINAYKSAFYGYRIGLNKLLAPFIGPKSVDCAQLAISQDPGNALGYIQKGHIQNYMPAVFGGSKIEAIKFYRMAEKIMEQQPETSARDWNYLSLLTIIAQAYCDIHDYRMAQAYYIKILKIEPGYTWVKNELYPQLLKKLQK